MRPIVNASTVEPPASSTGPDDAASAAPSASDDFQAAAGEDGGPPRRYEVRDGRLCHVATDRRGQKVTTWLSNFAAHIDEEVTYDDGTELRREFRVSGRLDTGETLPVARVAASELAALGWVLREWGARAVVFAGQGIRDHLRTALQTLSRPTCRRVYRHTGWIEHEGRAVFLFHGGAVGASGIEVDLPPPLDRFRLPAAVVDAPEAIGWSIRLLDCGPLEVTAPLVAAVYLSPLSTVLNPDVSVWLHGVSGSLKSTVSALAQAHFGEFDRKTLSASWSGTDNALLERLHVLKDVLSVIDDYAPQADSRAQSELDRRVQRVLRDVGNRAARSRLGGDLNQRPDRPPRGFLLSSGECLPPGHSINARLVHVEVDRRRLDLDAITALQANCHRLPHAMRAYLEWVGPRLEGLRTSLPRERDDLRSAFQRGGLHMRQPEALSNLFLGLDLFLRFATAGGAITDARAADIRASTAAAFRALAVRQAASLGVAVDPTESFVEALAGLLVRGEARLLERQQDVAPGDADVIGWRQGDLALLLPDATCRQVGRVETSAGGAAASSARSLHRDLVARGYLVGTRDGRDAGQWRVGPGGRKQRGWLLRLEKLLPGGAATLASTTPPPPPPHGDGETEGKQQEPTGNSRSSGRSPPAPPAFTRRWGVSPWRPTRTGR
jgi:hypothetical protein